MIDYKEQLRIQAYLDGELSEPEAREVASWLARDQLAGGLAAELRQTRTVVMAYRDEVRLPESRDFYWSKIRREIERQEQAADLPAASAVSWLALVRRALVPLAAVALLVFIGVVATSQSPLGTETALDDTGALTYHDYKAGATLVWLSYPAENELPDNDEAMLE